MDLSKNIIVVKKKKAYLDGINHKYN